MVREILFEATKVFKTEYFVFEGFLANAQGSRTFWTSASAAAGKWTWAATGKPITYFNWYTGQPDNEGGAENYILMNYLTNGMWNDVPNTWLGHDVYTICESNQ